MDAADHEKLDAAKNELHSLLDKPQLAGIPVSFPGCSCSSELDFFSQAQLLSLV